MTSVILEKIAARQALYQQVRDYFFRESVAEVEVPLLGHGSATDPHIASLTAESVGQIYYFQTSPELFMKRLLVAGSGSIFTICKAFRDGEQGSHHNPEFSMLEWYRLEYDLEALIEDVASLISSLQPTFTYTLVSYGELFQRQLGICPHSSTDADLLNAVKIHTGYGDHLQRSACLDLLMVQVVEPSLGLDPVFVVDFPVCQSAMAETRFNSQGQLVARRFELYMGGMEIANGYQELQDANTLLQRFETDNRQREENGSPPVAIDLKFVEAMQAGLPFCSGVALGMDRLLMQLYGNLQINEQILFPWGEL